VGEHCGVLLPLVEVPRCVSRVEKSSAGGNPSRLPRLPERSRGLLPPAAPERPQLYGLSQRTAATATPLRDSMSWARSSRSAPPVPASPAVSAALRFFEFQSFAGPVARNHNRSRSEPPSLSRNARSAELRCRTRHSRRLPDKAAAEIHLAIDTTGMRRRWRKIFVQRRTWYRSSS
jgi:hypothetical protein